MSQTEFLRDASLSISSKNIRDCNQVIEKLLSLGIMCSVSENKSVICKKDKCWTENGCDITITNINPNSIDEKVWKPLKSEYNLNCGFLNIRGHYLGCIKNYIRSSSCPGTK